MKKVVHIFILLGFLLIISCEKKAEQKEVIQPKKEVKETTVTKKEVKKEKPAGLVFTVQIGAYKNKNQKLTSVSGVQINEENALHKYRLGTFKSYQEARQLRQSLLTKYPDCFIQALKNNKPISISEALK